MRNECSIHAPKSLWIYTCMLLLDNQGNNNCNFYSKYHHHHHPFPYEPACLSLCEIFLTVQILTVRALGLSLSKSKVSINGTCSYSENLQLLMELSSFQISSPLLSQNVSLTHSMFMMGLEVKKLLGYEDLDLKNE